MKPIFTCCLLLLFGFTQAQTTAEQAKMIAAFNNDTIIKWMTIEQAEAAQKVNPKKVLVCVYATWCRWCRLEDSLTLKNAEIARYINANFYPVRFNAECRTTVTYKGVKYAFISDQNKWVNEFTNYCLNGKLSYPALAFFDEAGRLVNARNGYMDAYSLEPLLSYYGTNSYKQIGYKEYESDFEGKIPE
ncbi:MAG: DUF255 domain-containing protein [Chitinophagales bacterium]|nr:DUF255 domain-containing protein [Chitinophagales bacterium]